MPKIRKVTAKEYMYIFGVSYSTAKRWRQADMKRIGKPYITLEWLIGEYSVGGGLIPPKV